MANHPNTKMLNVSCSCGNQFEVLSTFKNEKLELDTCSKCHPFYTGKQKMIDTAGRLERFNKKYNKKSPVEKT
jgi:large subunit ribosomal protein L31